MPPDDPLGRHGPSLDNFLRKKPLTAEHRKQPCPYGKSPAPASRAILTASPDRLPRSACTHGLYLGDPYPHPMFLGLAPSVSHPLVLGEGESDVAQSCLTLCDPWTVAHQE